MTTEEADDLVRTLTARVRAIWAEMLGPDDPILRARYRAARRELLAVLVTRPGPVRVDGRTFVVPNADGDDVAFVADPEDCTPSFRKFCGLLLAHLTDLQRRRHARRAAR